MPETERQYVVESEAKRIGGKCFYSLSLSNSLKGIVRACVGKCACVRAYKPGARPSRHARARTNALNPEVIVGYPEGRFPPFIFRKAKTPEIVYLCSSESA